MVGLSEIGYAAVTVDRDKARTAIAPLAEKLGLTVEQTAEAIIRIAVSGMYSDVSGLVSRFGIDPREFACLAFGGAGPMMACFLARELGMKEVVVPPAPGVLSALGGLIADLKNDFLETLYLDLDDAAAATVRTAFAKLEARALTWLRQDQGYDGVSPSVLLGRDAISRAGVRTGHEAECCRGRGCGRNRDGGGVPFGARAGLRPRRPQGAAATDCDPPGDCRADGQAGIAAPHARRRTRADAARGGGVDGWRDPAGRAVSPGRSAGRASFQRPGGGDAG